MPPLWDDNLARLNAVAAQEQQSDPLREAARSHIGDDEAATLAAEGDTRFKGVLLFLLWMVRKGIIKWD